MLEYVEKRFETVVLTKEDFGDTLWENVAKMLELLTAAGYICTVKNDLGEKDIVVISYNYDAYNGFGNAVPNWLFPDEEELLDGVVSDMMEEIEESSKEKCVANKNNEIVEDITKIFEEALKGNK